MTTRFRNRIEAGQQLAQQLQAVVCDPNILVVALPRGGVPVAYEIAQVLQAPLDICLVRKLGVPEQVELAMGAIATGGIQILNQGIIAGFNISPQTLQAVAARERRELKRRDRVYRSQTPALGAQGRTVILVDDGLATGCTMRAAIAALKQQRPEQMIVAVPVASPITCAQLEVEVDQVVCLQQPQSLQAIGNWYHDFTQTTDAQVCDLLARQRRRYHLPSSASV